MAPTRPLYPKETYLFKFLLYYQKLIQFCLVHPRYTRQFLYKHNIIQQNGDQNRPIGRSHEDANEGQSKEEEEEEEDEVKIWKQFSDYNRGVGSVDFKQPQSNLVKIGEHEHAFVCMRTNCSELSPHTSLAEDLIQLPVFSICQSHLVWLYNPIINSGKLGLIVVALLGCGIFFLSIFIPVFDLLKPTTNRTIMFLLCPKLSARMGRARTRRLWQRLTTSYECFHDRNRRIINTTIHHSQMERHQRALLCQPRCQMQPINLTSWWFGLQQAATAHLAVAILLACCQVFILFFAYLYLEPLDSYRRQYARYGRHTSSIHCSIWWAPTQQAPFGNQTIDLDQFISSHAWNWWNTSELLVCVFMSLFNLAATNNCFIQSLNEIHVTIMELKIMLRIAIELSKLQMVSIPNSLDVIKTSPKPVGSFVHSIRTKIVSELIRQYFSLLLEKPMKTCITNETISTKGLYSKTAYQEFAMTLLERVPTNCQAEFVHLMETIQVNYWQLMELVDDFLGPIFNVLLMTNLINICFCLISVYFHWILSDVIGLPLVVNSMAIIATTIFIGLASTVHSRAAKLEPQFQSLIALNIDHPNRRIKHLTTLWTRQLDLIDTRGGISLAAFGSNVSYAGILKTLLWTTSIMLFAFTNRRERN